MGPGTINFINPGRSSTRIAGVQMRGQKAAAINAVAALFQLLAALVRMAIALIVYLVVGALNGAVWLHGKTSDLVAQWRFSRQQKQRADRTRQLEDAARQWRKNNRGFLEGLSPEACLAAMSRLLARAGGQPEAASPDRPPAHSEAGDKDKDRISKLAQQLFLVAGPESGNGGIAVTDLPATGTAVLATHYRDSVPAQELPNVFYRLDEMMLENGPRTVGQELLLEDIGDLFGLRLEAALTDSAS